MPRFPLAIGGEGRVASVGGLWLSASQGWGQGWAQGWPKVGTGPRGIDSETTAMGEAHVGSPLFATPEIAHECRPDGTVVLRSTREPGPAPRSLGALLERWAAADGRRVFMAERDPAGAWRRITYAEAARAVNAIAQSLLDRRLGPERPVVILADNGIDHALMMLGALHVGAPAVPVSTAYARLSQDFGKLRY